jgi:GxxExxY protein
MSNDEMSELFGAESLGPEMNALTFDIIGSAMDVHRILGPGYLENVYQAALEVELRLRGIAFSSQHSFALDYKGHEVGHGKLDLFVAGKVIVELKAVDQLTPLHRAQLMNYLRANGVRLGLLINFNVPILKEGIRRIAY